MPLESNYYIISQWKSVNFIVFPDMRNREKRWANDGFSRVHCIWSEASKCAAVRRTAGFDLKTTCAADTFIRSNLEVIK